LQFFGHVAIEGATGSLTVTLKDVADRALWSTTLDPAAAAPAQMTTMSL
jgi:alkaline phosphatase D